MSLLDLPRIEVSGTPSELGEVIGRSLQIEITAMIDRSGSIVPVRAANTHGDEGVVATPSPSIPS
ncbi:MAG: hypothetical protein QGI75_06020 [Phycisphaerales bacterium]|jgi:hypothetical protein|nr:hypothetical protein [Phycisphaerales bacterium]MDP6890282.1 hypothetical protein [Phycisphaerales bacterium]